MRFVAAFLLAVACLSAQQTFTVEQLLSFIRSSIQLQHPDKEVAAFLGKVKLSERLEDRAIEDLQGRGAGPRTLAALRELRDASAQFAKPAPQAPPLKPAPIPPPPPEEQQAIIDEVREYAMNYSKSLPDFICTQVTRRYYDPTGLEFWRSADTITARLSYFEQHEDYKLVLVNNQYTNQRMEQLGGATSTGEFGSLLKLTLAKKADPQIEWDHWAKLRGHLCYVFSYRVSSYNSDWRISWEHTQEILTAYRGLIYVDKETRQVLRILLEAEEIPPSFPVQEARTTLDYDYAKIGDRDFLLPLKFVTRMRSEKLLSKNESEFRMYRKFAAEATVTFDTPDPLPEDQTKEQPPK